MHGQGSFCADEAGRYSLKAYHSLSDVAELWFEVQGKSSNKSVCANFMLLNAWYKCFLNGRESMFISLWDRGECIGIYPFVFESRYGLKILNTLYQESGAYNINVPVVADGREDVFYAQLLKQMHGEEGRLWDVLKISGMYCFQGTNLFLVQALEGIGANVVVREDKTFAVRIDDTFEKYCDVYLSKKTVLDIRRVYKKANGKNYVFSVQKGPDALKHVDRFLEMENTGWKKDAGTSLVLANDYLVYTGAFVGACAAAEKLVMTFVEMDGVKVAGQLCYIEDGIFNIVKTAYDREYKEYSPSVLLFLDTIRHLIASHPEVKIVHYYPVSYGYKHKYSREDFPCYTYTIFSEGIKGKMLRWLHNFKN